LSDHERDGCAHAVTELAAPGATLLMMALAPNRVPLEPAGADEAEIAARFTGWNWSDGSRTAAGRRQGRCEACPLRGTDCFAGDSTLALTASPSSSRARLRNWHDAYYGANYKRLLALCRSVDPKHIFTFPQAIGR